MKALVIGLAAVAGPAIAWHMRAVARRWSYTPDRPSGLARTPRSRPPRLLSAAPGPDGSQPVEAHR